MANSNATANLIKSNVISAEMRQERASYSHAVKDLFTYKSACKTLGKLLSGINERDVIYMASAVCAEKGFGEQRKDKEGNLVFLKSGEPSIKKPSAYGIMTYLVKHQTELPSIVEANRKAAEERKAAAAAAKAAEEEKAAKLAALNEQLNNGEISKKDFNKLAKELAA